MSSEDKTSTRVQTLNRSVSRRDFLRLAGVAGIAVAFGGTAGGLLSACGDEEAPSTTTTSANTTSSSSPSATTGTSETSGSTSVSSGPTGGRPIKVGVAAPRTGALALFAVPMEWYVSHIKEATKDGVLCGDGTTRQLDIIIRDTQSDSNRAASVTADLIQVDGVDIMTAGGSPDTVNPSADQCEALGCPGLFNQSPWQAFAYGRQIPEEGFKWTYLHDIGSEQTITNFVYMFDQVPNNKVVGMLFANDADAVAWMDPSAAPKVFAEKGYTLVTPDYYMEGAEDFTQQISVFKKEGCDIICGTNNPPSFINFWKQAYQQGYQPKLVSSGKALIFASAVEAMGDIGNGLIGEVTWHPRWPYKDSVTGWDGAQIVEDYEAVTQTQWTCALKGYALMEWVVDIFKRAANPEDKESVVEAIANSNFTNIVGHCDFTSPIDVNTWHPVKNVYKAAYSGGQWVKGTKNPYELHLCAAVEVPGFDGTLDPVQTLQY